MKFKATVFVLISSMFFISFYISVPAFAKTELIHFRVGNDKQYFIYISTDPPNVIVDECKVDTKGDWHCNNIAHDRNIPAELKGALDRLTLSPENAANPTNGKNSTSPKGLDEPGIRSGDGGLTIQK
jgi:hypothetical protein